MGLTKRIPCQQGDNIMTMIRVAQLRDTVDRAREEIDDARVFDEAMQQSMIRFESACAEASFPAIVDEPEVVAACDALIKGVVGLLFARAVGAKAWPFKLRAANREIDRAALIAHTAYDDLIRVVKKAMVANVGFDGTHDGFLNSMISELRDRDDQ
jgi:hypothetical protein